MYFNVSDRCTLPQLHLSPNYTSERFEELVLQPRNLTQTHGADGGCPPPPCMGSVSCSGTIGTLNFEDSRGDSGEKTRLALFQAMSLERGCHVISPLLHNCRCGESYSGRFRRLRNDHRNFLSRYAGLSPPPWAVPIRICSDWRRPSMCYHFQPRKTDLSAVFEVARMSKQISSRRPEATQSTIISNWFSHPQLVRHPYSPRRALNNHGPQCFRCNGAFEW